MARELFRPEAVEHARQKLGLPIDNFGVKSWVLVGFLTLVMACAIVFLATARYSKKETVFGAVVPGQGVLRVSPLRTGTVAKVLVESGSLVKKGQPLFAISYDVTLEDGNALSGAMRRIAQQERVFTKEQVELRRQHLMRERRTLLLRQQSLIADAEGFAKQRAIQADRISLLESTVDSSRQLHAQEYMSAVQLRQREDALLQARQSLLQLDQSIQQSRSQMAQLQQEAAGLLIQIAELEAEHALGTVRLEEKRFQNLAEQGGQVVSTANARVASLQARPGDLVAPGQALALLIPDTGGAKQMVQLWAPSRAIGFVRVGANVRLMFDAFPYQTFGVGTGKVVEVSNAPVMPSDLPVPIETKEQMYRIIVALDRDRLNAYGRDWPLSPGMRLTADLVLDERSLLEWLLDPLIATRKRMG